LNREVFMSISNVSAAIASYLDVARFSAPPTSATEQTGKSQTGKTSTTQLPSGEKIATTRRITGDVVSVTTEPRAATTGTQSATTVDITA